MKCHQCNVEITIDDHYSTEDRTITVYRAGLYNYKKSEEIGEAIIVRCLPCTKLRVNISAIH